MSLGFLTESALLPSKAKKIDVDSRTILDLKAVVYEQQQHTQKNMGESLRSKRGFHTKNSDKDVFLRSNPGIAERERRDLQERELSKNKSRTALEKKAALYDRLKRGDLPAEDAGFLVDFSSSDQAVDHRERTVADEKKLQTSLDHSGAVLPWDVATSGGDDAVDEFGRQPDSRRSNCKRKAEDLDDMRRTGNAMDDGETGQQRWPVSSGEHRHGECGEWRHKDEVDPKSAGMKHFGLAVGVEGSTGFVKSRWHVTLNDKEKRFLKEIAEETKERRKTGDSSDHKDTKEKRRDMLRQKLQARKLNIGVKNDP